MLKLLLKYTCPGFFKPISILKITVAENINAQVIAFFEMI
jgi:hypothetical protein